MKRTYEAHIAKIEIRNFEGLVRVTLADGRMEMIFDVYPDRDGETFEPKETLVDVAARVSKRKFSVMISDEDEP